MSTRDQPKSEVSAVTNIRKGLKSGDVNREKTCPLLLRVFPRNGGHNRPEDFHRLKDTKLDEVQIYTWKDATLRELTELIKDVQDSAKRSNARIDFAFVYPDLGGRFVSRRVGSCWSTVRKGDRRDTSDDAKTLDELRFQIGDYLDVAIYQNSHN